ncbi:NAD-dependent epimerase/dehydratase family protein [Sphingomonas sp. 28-63-12]|uniref:NAD-dependent epimerase/dehydratase family protein n=1 Tax=Sphingomonas sp. 28-63-12 TaxID=1970434 RepID=UPI000BC41B36|nr:MAG: UDP-glucuronate 5-epimerase [Sphingomonas sp. 28-63-12]
MTATGNRILVTGSAGFVGMHVARALLDQGHQVLGIDNFSDYYDVALKEQRNARLAEHPNFRVARLSIDDMAAFAPVWEDFAPDIVIHLAAQAGVRYSIDHPETYVASNLVGSFNVLELARRTKPAHLLAASTSSIYGGNSAMPFRETDQCATPLTFYAATKGATELMGHSYAHLFGVPMTFFRFFTVYGPWGRPDMALFKFTKAIIAGTPIDVYNRGEMVRDFTYVEDLAEAVVRLMAAIPGVTPVSPVDSLSPVAPFRVVNIGQGDPVRLLDYIAAIEAAIGTPAIMNLLPLQPGEVLRTEASTDLLRALIDYVPATPVAIGVPKFVDWYRRHHGC